MKPFFLELSVIQGPCGSIFGLALGAIPFIWEECPLVINKDKTRQGIIKR